MAWGGVLGGSEVGGCEVEEGELGGGSELARTSAAVATMAGLAKQINVASAGRKARGVRGMEVGRRREEDARAFRLCQEHAGVGVDGTEALIDRRFPRRSEPVGVLLSGSRCVACRPPPLLISCSDQRRVEWRR